MSEYRVDPGAERTAVLLGAPAGRAPGRVTLRVIDATGADYLAAGPAAELEPGTYARTYTAPDVAGTYLEAWTDLDAPGVDIEPDTLVVGYTRVSLPPPTGPSYTTPDALRAELELDAAALPDATAERLIRDAERRIDRIAGAWAIRLDGRKFAPAELGPTIGARLQDATLILAAAAQRNPGAFTPPAGKSVIGPDFRVMDIAGLPPAGQVALRDAAAILDVANLRTLTARARP